MSRDSRGILPRRVFAISHEARQVASCRVKTHQLHLIVAHRQPALTPKDSVRRKSVPQQNSYCCGGQLLHRVLQIDLPKCRDHMDCASDVICVFSQA